MKNLLIVVLFLFTAGINATICEGKSSYDYRFRLELPQLYRGDITVMLTVTDSSGKVMRTGSYIVHNTWDGHSTGLMTAPGLSIRYRDSYGRIHGVVLTTLTHETNGWMNTAELDCRE